MAKRQTAQEGDIWIKSKDGCESHWLILTVERVTISTNAKVYQYNVILLETGEQHKLETFYPIRKSRHWLNGNWRPA